MPQFADLAPSSFRATLADWLEASPRHARAFAQADRAWRISARANELSLADLDLPSTVKRSRSAWRNHAIRGSVFAVAAGLAILLFLSTPRGPVTVAERVFTRTAETGAEHIKRLDLPDGSIVRLNTGTEIRVAYTEDARTIRLARGEAHFEVARDPERPFQVSSAGVTVRALGTAFDIALRLDSVEVLVTEGRVSMETSTNSDGDEATGVPGGSPALIEAGQKVVLSLGISQRPVAERVDTEDVRQSLAWQDHRLKFASASLAEILSEFNRYNARPLEIASDSPALGELRFAGSFRADDPETFLQLIQTHAEIQMERRPDRTLLRLASPKK